MSFYNNTKGIASVFILLILLGGLVVGGYLVQNPQVFKSRAWDLSGATGGSEATDLGGSSAIDIDYNSDLSSDFDNPDDLGDFSTSFDENPEGSGSMNTETGFNSDVVATSTFDDDDDNNPILVVADEVVVKFRSEAIDKKENASKFLKKHRAVKVDALGVYVLKVVPRERQALIDALNTLEAVEYAESNYITKFSQVTPNDPEFNSGQYGLKQIKAPLAWDVTKGGDALIAVIDTGVNSQHPDLANKVALNYNFLTNSSVASDDNGHGTHVAGIIAAGTNNNIGVAGVSWNNKIMNLKALNQNGYGTDISISKAIIFAVDNGAKVMNLSLGRQAYGSTLESAVNYATSRNVVVVAAAGNFGTSRLVYPASYDRVIAVSAIDSTDNKAAFSSWGDWIDLSAPGVEIQSTSLSLGYERKSGTSMAAPFVAGTASLVWASGATSADDVINKLRVNADDIGDSGPDLFFGAGRLDAEGSVKNLAQVVTTSPPRASPSVTITPTATPGSDGSTSDFERRTIPPKPSPSVTIRPTATPKSDSTSNTDNTEPLSINITQPRNGERISRKGKIRIRTRSSDNVVKVEFYYDNQLKCTDTGRPFQCNLKAKSKTSGDKNHIITAKAYDQGGASVQNSIEIILTK